MTEERNPSDERLPELVSFCQNVLFVDLKKYAEEIAKSLENGGPDALGSLIVETAAKLKCMELVFSSILIGDKKKHRNLRCWSNSDFGCCYHCRKGHGKL